MAVLSPDYSRNHGIVALSPSISATDNLAEDKYFSTKPRLSYLCNSNSQIRKQDLLKMEKPERILDMIDRM
jgi:hypothetical protein